MPKEIVFNKICFSVLLEKRLAVIVMFRNHDGYCDYFVVLLWNRVFLIEIIDHRLTNYHLLRKLNEDVV